MSADQLVVMRDFIWFWCRSGLYMLLLWSVGGFVIAFILGARE